MINLVFLYVGCARGHTLFISTNMSYVLAHVLEQNETVVLDLLKKQYFWKQALGFHEGKRV